MKNKKKKFIVVSIIIFTVISFSIWFFNNKNNTDEKPNKKRESIINNTIETKEIKNKEINDKKELEKLIEVTPIIKEDSNTKEDVIKEKNNDIKKEETKKESVEVKNQEENKSQTTKTEQPVNNPKPLNLKEQNMQIIKEIKDLYGYDVSYGTEEFWYNGVPSIQLTDEEVANRALIELKNKSAIFPTNFFRTFQGYNGFRILLYANIDGAAGVASYEFGNDNLIALNVSTDFLGRVFYHETFHIMEQYINYKTYGMTNPFDNWQTLNPTNFNYNSYDESFSNTAYDFDNYSTPSAISFVSVYAKSSAHEDRAELFADLMFRGIKKNYMYKGFGINEKAKSLSLIIRNYFPNSAGAVWEKYIDWS